MAAVEEGTVIARADEHLDPATVAAYIDRTLDDRDRPRVEAHLADCDECRAEVVEAKHIVSTLRGTSKVTTKRWLGVAAAAAVILLVAVPRHTREPDTVHREAPVMTTIAPHALAPQGLTSGPLVLRWTSVPGADGYRVRVFDERGSVLFERETKDTVAPVAATLGTGTRLFWKVEAQTGFDRRAASDLVEFTLTGRR